MSELNHNGKNIGWLAEQIGMSRNGLKKALELNTIEFRKLKLIAEALSITIEEIIGLAPNKLNAEKLQLQIQEQAQLINKQELIIREKLDLIIQLIKSNK